MINAALVPLETQLFCLRNTNFSTLSGFDLGEDKSSTAVPAHRSQFHGDNEEAEGVFPSLRNGKTKQLSLWSPNWRKPEILFNNPC